MSTKFASSATLAVIAAAGLFSLGACSREADRAARGDAGSTAAETSVAAARSDYSSGRGDYSSARSSDTAARPRVSDADVKKADDGKPEWASNRTRSGEENAQKQFQRDGQDFGASSVADYVKKAHAFVDSPPKDVQTVSRRNGDVLYYDPKANVFAVADREGAPRAMFKPRDGMSYWLKQKQSDSDSSRRRGGYASRGDRGSDQGSSSDDQSDG